MIIIFNIRDIYSLVEREVISIVEEDKRLGIGVNKSISTLVELWFTHNLHSMYIVLFSDMGGEYRTMCTNTLAILNRTHWGLSSLFYRILRIPDKVFEKEVVIKEITNSKIVFKFTD